MSTLSLEPPPHSGLLLGYAVVNEREIEAGARRLATALRSLPIAPAE